MSTVREILTNVANNTRKFLGTEEQLSLEEMSQGIAEASDESDFQTELIEEFSTILDRSVAPDDYVNGKEDGFADALEQRTDLVVTENGEYAPEEGSTGFKSVIVNIPSDADALIERSVTELKSGATTVGSFAFYQWASLKTVDLSKATTIRGSAFAYCRTLTALILRSETMCTLSSSDVFSNCNHILGTYGAYNPDSLKDGYFYVPRALLSDDDETKDYRRATYWSSSSLASQFRALEDYTVDGTITGALDPTKI